MMGRRGLAWYGVFGAGAILACSAAAATPARSEATGVAPDAETGRAPAAVSPVLPQQEMLVPAGHGTLKQDEVTLSLRSGSLLVKVTPLSEHVIRLTAPDTYTRLHSLAENRREELSANAMSTPELFLVSFFSYQKNVAFQPEDLQLVHQGRLLRPIGVSPVTGGWGQQLLQQQENQLAVYAFDGPINYEQPLTVRYGLEETDAWRDIIVRLRAERNRVQSRAGAGER